MPEKLLELYPIRISQTLQHNLKKLSATETNTMLKEVRDLMARHVHNSEAIFDPKIYQDEEMVN